MLSASVFCTKSSPMLFGSLFHGDQVISATEEEIAEQIETVALALDHDWLSVISLFYFYFLIFFTNLVVELK